MAAGDRRRVRDDDPDRRAPAPGACRRGAGQCVSVSLSHSVVSLCGGSYGGMAEGMMESIRNYMNPPGIQGPGAVRPPGIQGPVGGPSNMGPGSFGPGPDRFNGNLGDTLFGEGGITDMRARAPWEMNNVYRQQPMIAPTPY